MDMLRVVLTVMLFLVASASEDKSRTPKNKGTMNVWLGTEKFQNGILYEPSHEVCDKSDEDGIQILQYINIKPNYETSDKCKLKSHTYSSNDYEEFETFSSNCNNKTRCEFKLLALGNAKNCYVEIKYVCREKKEKDIDSSVPDSRNRGHPKPKEVYFTTTSINTSEAVVRKGLTSPSTSDVDDESDDEEQKDEEKQYFQMDMISIIAIGLACIVFIAIIIIAILCGVFVCGRSATGRWARRYNFQQQQQNGQRHHVVEPLDEYAYIDESKLLSELKASPSPPSTAQPFGQQVSQKFPQTCDRSRQPVRANGPFRVVPTVNPFADYAEVSESNDAKDSGEGRKTLIVPTPASHIPRFLVKANPENPIVGDNSNVLNKERPVVNNPSTLLFASTSKTGKVGAVEYTLPVKKSQQSGRKLPLKSPAPLPKPIKRESEKTPDRSRGEEMLRPTKSIAFSTSASRKSPQLRQAPPLSVGALRRASLPRHSKLMENDTDQHDYATTNTQPQLYSKLNSLSQPNLVKRNLNVCTKDDLYSHLGDSANQTVFLNVYNG